MLSNWSLVGTLSSQLANFFNKFTLDIVVIYDYRSMQRRAKDQCSEIDTSEVLEIDVVSR